MSKNATKYLDEQRRIQRLLAIAAVPLTANAIIDITGIYYVTARYVLHRMFWGCLAERDGSPYVYKLRVPK